MLLRRVRASRLVSSFDWLLLVLVLSVVIEMFIGHNARNRAYNRLRLYLLGQFLVAVPVIVFVTALLRKTWILLLRLLLPSMWRCLVQTIRCRWPRILLHPRMPPWTLKPRVLIRFRVSVTVWEITPVLTGMLLGMPKWARNVLITAVPNCPTRLLLSDRQN